MNVDVYGDGVMYVSVVNWIDLDGVSALILIV